MDVSTDLSILMTEAEWNKVLADMPQRLREGGVEPRDINAEIVSFTCEPDNILVNEYMTKHGHAPVSEHVWRVIVNGSMLIEDWVDRDNKNRYTMKIKALEVNYADEPSRRSNDSDEAPATSVDKLYDETPLTSGANSGTPW